MLRHLAKGTFTAMCWEPPLTDNRPDQPMRRTSALCDGGYRICHYACRRDPLSLFLSICPLISYHDSARRCWSFVWLPARPGCSLELSVSVVCWARHIEEPSEFSLLSPLIKSLAFLFFFFFSFVKQNTLLLSSIIRPLSFISRLPR